MAVRSRPTAAGHDWPLYGDEYGRLKFGNVPIFADHDWPLYGDEYGRMKFSNCQFLPFKFASFEWPLHYQFLTLILCCPCWNPAKSNHPRKSMTAMSVECSTRPVSHWRLSQPFSMTNFLNISHCLSWRISRRC